MWPIHGNFGCLGNRLNGTRNWNSLEISLPKFLMTFLTLFQTQYLRYWNLALPTLHTIANSYKKCYVPSTWHKTHPLVPQVWLWWGGRWEAGIEASSGPATRNTLESSLYSSFPLSPSFSRTFSKGLEALMKQDFSDLVGALSEEEDE